MFYVCGRISSEQIEQKKNVEVKNPVRATKVKLQASGCGKTMSSRSNENEPFFFFRLERIT